MSGAPVVVVGAGLAGLSCAKILRAAGVDVRVVEAQDGVGGRVRTDVEQGFLIDRGFQVLFTAYPEVQAQLDLEALQLRSFLPGAQVLVDGGAYDVSDPFREPLSALSGLLAPIGTVADKLRVLRLRADVVGADEDAIWRRENTSTLQRLQDAGFSRRMIDTFFRPFFGGIFLGRDLEPSRRVFDFLYRMLSMGDTVLPRQGMGAIAAQLASSLPAGAVHLGAPVSTVSARTVTMADGIRVDASAVVVATDGSAAARLTGGAVADVAWRGVTTLSFAAERSPLPTRRLVLNAADGVINTMCTLSDVQPSYAPPGQALISVTSLQTAADNGPDDAELVAAVRRELRGFYGKETEAWRLLRISRVPQAQPRLSTSTMNEPERPVRLDSGVFVCGDHRDHPSIHGAMRSGRRAAEAVLAALKTKTTSTPSLTTTASTETTAAST